MWREEEAWDPKVEAVMVGVIKDEVCLLSFLFGLVLFAYSFISYCYFH